jgi:hypothetical protein
MSITVHIEDVDWMLEVARFHFRGLESEHRKTSGRDLLALQAYLVACLQAGASVFYSLVNPSQDFRNTFESKARKWKSELQATRKGDYDFFFRMVEHHRGSTAHAATVNASVVLSVPPAAFDQVNMTESHLLPMPSAEIALPKLRLDAMDAVPTCTRFLSLLGELVQYCKA